MRERHDKIDGDRDQLSFPRPLRRFVELFNRREFWNSHEVLEDPWRRRNSDFYQGLILYASAFVHAQRGNRHGILAQLEKTEQRLQPYAPYHLGVDVAAILRHAQRCREIVHSHPHASRDSWSDLIPFPILILEAALLRGDEPELQERKES